MASWLCLPIAPLNPVEEDTLAAMNLHIAAGVSNPNGIVSVGPNLSTRWEMLAIHPLMVRGTADLTYGRMNSNLFPKGHLYAATFGTDLVYYRGTDRLTGYIGLGVVYGLHHFRMFDETADSLFVNELVTEVDLQQQFGYRLTLGLRYHKSYSIEVAIVEMEPDFKKTGTDGNGGATRSYQTTRTGNFKVSLGYLFEI